MAVEGRQKKFFYFYITFQRKDTDILEMSKHNNDGDYKQKEKKHSSIL